MKWGGGGEQILLLHSEAWCSCVAEQLMLDKTVFIVLVSADLLFESSGFIGICTALIYIIPFTPLFDARLAHFHLQELTSGLPVLSTLFFLLPLLSPHHLISVMITLCLADLRWCNHFLAADFTLAKHYILPSFWELAHLSLCLPLFPFGTFFKGFNLFPNVFSSNSSMRFWGEMRLMGVEGIWQCS